MAPSSELQPAAWLYTRDDESVHVEVHENEGVWAASIMGPGPEQRLRVFHDQVTFDLFRAEHDRELVSKGFRLMAMAERRSGEVREKEPAVVVKHERRRPRREQSPRN